MDWQEIVVACIGCWVIFSLLRGVWRMRKRETGNLCRGCGQSCPHPRIRHRRMRDGYARCGSAEQRERS